MTVTASFSFQIPKESQLKVKKGSTVNQGDLITIEIKTPLSGQITDVAKDKVELSFVAQELKANWGIGAPKIGQVVCLEKEKANIFDLTGDFENKIVVVKGSFNLGFWHKGVSLGMSGVVAAGLGEKNLREIIQQEDFLGGAGLPVLLYEEVVFPHQVWQIFQKNEGEEAVIEGEKKRVLLPVKP